MGAGGSAEKQFPDPRPYIEEGDELVSKGHFLQAKKVFLVALESTAFYQGADSLEVGRMHTKIGDMYLRQRSFKEAVTSLTEAQRIFDVLRRDKAGTTKPTPAEYKLMMSNLAFAQYHVAQSMDKGSQDYKDLSSKALVKFNALGELKKEAKEIDTTAAERMTIVASIQYGNNNLIAARKTLGRTGVIQKKQKIPTTGTQRIFKNMQSAMMTANAILLIQRVMRRKLRYLRWKKILAEERELMEEWEYACREALYEFEDDISYENNLIYIEEHEEAEELEVGRYDRIKEQIEALEEMADEMKVRLLEEEEEEWNELIEGFNEIVFAYNDWVANNEEHWIERIQEFSEITQPNVYSGVERQEAVEWDALMESFAEGKRKVRRREKERFEAYKKIHGELCTGSVDGARAIMQQEDKEWKDMLTKFHKDKDEIERQNIVREELQARRKLRAKQDELEKQERAALAKKEAETRKALIKFLEARDRAIRELLKKEEAARNALQNEEKKFWLELQQLENDERAQAEIATVKRLKREAQERREVNDNESADRTAIIREEEEEFGKIMFALKKDRKEAEKRQEEREKRAAVEAKKAEAQRQKDLVAAQKQKKLNDIKQQKQKDEQQLAWAKMQEEARLARIKYQDDDDESEEEVEEVQEDGTVVVVTRKRRRIPPEELEMLRKHFKLVDKDGSGEIDKDEFADFYNAVMKTNLPKRETNDIFNQLDVDGGGTLSFDEFCEVYRLLQGIDASKTSKDTIAAIALAQKKMREKAARRRASKQPLDKKAATKDEVAKIRGIASEDMDALKSNWAAFDPEFVGLKRDEFGQFLQLMFPKITNAEADVLFSVLNFDGDVVMFDDFLALLPSIQMYLGCDDPAQKEEILQDLKEKAKALADKKKRREAKIQMVLENAPEGFEYDDAARVVDTFDAFDSQGKDALTKDPFTEFIQRAFQLENPNNELIGDIFDAIDIHEDGLVVFDLFCPAIPLIFALFAEQDPQKMLELLQAIRNAAAEADARKLLTDDLGFSTEEAEHLLNCFNTASEGRPGLDKGEFLRYLNMAYKDGEWSPEDADEIFKILDAKNKGRILPRSALRAHPVLKQMNRKGLSKEQKDHYLRKLKHAVDKDAENRQRLKAEEDARAKFEFLRRKNRDLPDFERKKRESEETEFRKRFPFLRKGQGVFFSHLRLMDDEIFARLYRQWDEERNKPKPDKAFISRLENDLFNRAVTLLHTMETMTDKERAAAEKAAELAKKRAAVEARKEEERRKKEALEEERRLREEEIQKKREATQKAKDDMAAKKEAELMIKKLQLRAQRAAAAGEDLILLPEEIAVLQAHFERVDVDHGGTIDKEEFVEFYSNVIGSSMTNKEIGDLFDKLDEDGGGSLDFEEFCNVYKEIALMEAAKKDVNVDHMKNAVDRLNKKNEANAKLREKAKALKEQLAAKKEAEALMKKINIRALKTDGDGEYDYTPEEIAMLQSHFERVASEGSGSITKKEFIMFYQNLMDSVLTKKEIGDLFDKLDADGGGTLDFEEFLQVYKVMAEAENSKKDPLYANKVKEAQAKRAEQQKLGAPKKSFASDRKRSMRRETQVKINADSEGSSDGSESALDSGEEAELFDAMQASDDEEAAIIAMSPFLLRGQLNVDSCFRALDLTGNEDYAALHAEYTSLKASNKDPKRVAELEEAMLKIAESIAAAMEMYDASDDESDEEQDKSANVTLAEEFAYLGNPHANFKRLRLLSHEPFATRHHERAAAKKAGNTKEVERLEKELKKIFKFLVHARQKARKEARKRNRHAWTRPDPEHYRRGPGRFLTFPRLPRWEKGQRIPKHGERTKFGSKGNMKKHDYLKRKSWDYESNPFHREHDTEEEMAKHPFLKKGEGHWMTPVRLMLEDEEYRSLYEERLKVLEAENVDSERLRYLEDQLRARAAILAQMHTESANYEQELADKKKSSLAQRRAAVEARKEEERRKKEALEEERRLREEEMAKKREATQKAREDANAKKEAELMIKKLQLRAQRANAAGEELVLLPEEITLLQSHFELVDVDHGGTIDKEEFVEFYYNVVGTTMAKKEILDLFDKLDEDGGGSLDFEEFCNVYKEIALMEAAKKDAASMKNVVDRLNKKNEANAALREKAKRIKEQLATKKEAETMMKKMLIRATRAGESGEAFELQPSEIETLKGHFEQVDTSNTGNLSKKEFIVFYQNTGTTQLSKKEIADVFDRLDQDGGGTLDFEEFCNVYKEMALMEAAKKGVGKFAPAPPGKVRAGAQRKRKSVVALPAEDPPPTSKTDERLEEAQRKKEEAAKALEQRKKEEEEKWRATVEANQRREEDKKKDLKAGLQRKESALEEAAREREEQRRQKLEAQLAKEKELEAKVARNKRRKSSLRRKFSHRPSVGEGRPSSEGGGGDRLGEIEEVASSGEDPSASDDEAEEILKELDEKLEANVAAAKAMREQHVKELHDVNVAKERKTSIIKTRQQIEQEEARQKILEREQLREKKTEELRQQKEEERRKRRESKERRRSSAAEQEDADKPPGQRRSSLVAEQKEIEPSQKPKESKKRSSDAASEGDPTQKSEDRKKRNNSDATSQPDDDKKSKRRESKKEVRGGSTHNLPAVKGARGPVPPSNGSSTNPRTQK